nr:MAG TPA: hypothetical protein [Caudoviricetes sp.]
MCIINYKFMVCISLYLKEKTIYIIIKQIITN